MAPIKNCIPRAKQRALTAWKGVIEESSAPHHSLCKALVVTSSTCCAVPLCLVFWLATSLFGVLDKQGFGWNLSPCEGYTWKERGANPNRSLAEGNAIVATIPTRQNSSIRYLFSVPLQALGNFRHDKWLGENFMAANLVMCGTLVVRVSSGKIIW